MGSYRILRTDLFLFFVISLPLFLVAFIFDFNGLYGQDGYEYVKITRDLENYFFQGTDLTYSVFPIGYPFAGFILSQLVGNNIIALQLISIFSCSFSCIYLRKLLRLIYGDKKLVAVYVIVFFLFSPYVLRFSLLVMSDMLCVFLLLATLFYSISFMRANKLKHLIFLSMFASFAFYTRYASGIILVIIASMLFVYLIRSKQVKYLFIPVIIFAAVTLPDFFIRGRFIIWDVSDQQLHLSYFYVPKQWGILNYFKKDFSNLDGAQHYDYPNLLFAMQNWLHPAFIFCGIFFMLNLRKQDFNLNEIQWLLLATVAYLLFVAGYPYQSNRYLLLTFPFIIVMFYPAFLKIRQKYFHREALSKSIIAVLIFAQVFLFGYSIQIIYATNRNEKLIAQSVKNYPGKPIYTFSIDGALRTYGVQNTIIEIYSSRIDSVMPNSLLLFNYEHFYIQFEKLNPMINWERITDSNYLEQIEEFSNGWRLYAIKSKPFNDSF